MTEAFDRLARPVQKWVRTQGWSELRDIQARTVHAILDDRRDLIVMASTAGGKTEAAFLPLISQLLEAKTPGGISILSVSPLKALINDQHRRIADICRDAELDVTPWHGDIAASIKATALKNPSGIVIITPESLEALFVRRGTEISRLFASLNAVVIDELHTFVDSERGMQLRSLLSRLELSIGRPVRRIGLSATLGDPELAARALRPDQPDSVRILKAAESNAELHLQLKGYINGNDGETESTTSAVSRHLFEKLRGTNNLVFAGSRQRVEIYADSLRQMSEDMHMPQEFYPHHASLSRDHRDFVEKRLKTDGRPTTAVCTSTLELGIDIGDVASVAQIGAPFSVAGLRQRLGRSGRRPGQPAVLRQYVIEAAKDASSSFPDRLRLGLMRSIAMIELMLESWSEPPKPQAMHLSTLTHQVLSVIAEKGGASAKRLYITLCQHGPFREVDQETFLEVLRSLGHPETALVEQAPDGLLLLGKTGERLVEHYSFYAVFQTPEEFRLRTRDRELGALPIDNVMTPGMLLIFSGRRWEILEIDDREKVILVKPAAGGNPPIFGGDPGDIHDVVIERMFELFVDDAVPIYLDATAKQLLLEARIEYRRLDLDQTRLVRVSDHMTLLATGKGSVTTTTLALALRTNGLPAETYDGFLLVDQRDSESQIDLRSALAELGQQSQDLQVPDDATLAFEKFHPYLERPLLVKDALSGRLATTAMVKLAADLSKDIHRKRGVRYGLE